MQDLRLEYLVAFLVWNHLKCTPPGRSPRPAFEACLAYVSKHDHQIQQRKLSAILEFRRIFVPYTRRVLQAADGNAALDRRDRSLP